MLGFGSICRRQRISSNVGSAAFQRGLVEAGRDISIVRLELGKPDTETQEADSFIVRIGVNRRPSAAIFEG